jgi:hypothetical protein
MDAISHRPRRSYRGLTPMRMEVLQEAAVRMLPLLHPIRL